MKKNVCMFPIVAIATFVLFHSSGYAQTVLVSVTGRTHVTSSGNSTGAVSYNNYYAQQGQANNAFVWNLSSQSPTTLLSAKIFINNTGSGITGSGTYTIYDVNSSSATLLNSGAAFSNQTAVFSDLGGGTSYGSASYSPANLGNFIVLDLNPAGLSALQAAWGAGFFTIGGAAVGSGFVFGGTANIPDSEVYIQAAVPEPSAFSLMVLGVGGLAMLRRRRE